MQTKTVWLGVAALMMGLLLGAGCDSGASSQSGLPKVVATTTMIGDLVSRIADDKVELRVLMPAGVDPHTFKPSTADLGSIKRANLIVYNGLHLEGKMVEMLEHDLKDRSVAITSAIPDSRQLKDEGGAHDPHVWFDVSLWRLAAGAVRDALVKLDPGNSETYLANAKALDTELESLDAEVRQKLNAIPPERRVLITSHDAYGYFGKAYGVTVYGLQGISTETEAALASMNRAVDFILERKIPAVFVESSVSHKTIERVQADCKARGFEVKIGGELYSDAMGTAGERPGYAVETYIGMVRFNVDTFTKAISP